MPIVARSVALTEASTMQTAQLSGFTGMVATHRQRCGLGGGSSRMLRASLRNSGRAHGRNRSMQVVECRKVAILGAAGAGYGYMVASRAYAQARWRGSPSTLLHRGAGGIGQPLSLLMKMSNLASDIALYDIANTPGVAADLSHCNTPAKASQPGFVFHRLI